MLYNSLAFGAFFVVVFAVYWRLDRRAQNLFLLASSYLFYAAWDWRFLGLIFLSTAVDFWAGKSIAAAARADRKKAFLGISVAVNLGILLGFKYLGFLAESFSRFANAFGWDPGFPTLAIVLPVGISFYTFQSLSYTIDAYRGKLKPEKDPIRFALFVAYFPQLLSGPIERGGNLLPQLAAQRLWDPKEFSRGLWLISYGFLLKLFVADNLALYVDDVFGRVRPENGLEALLASYGFAFQVLGDFAGYSAISIGLSKWLGIRLSRNFGQPYLAGNLREFWGHWHITMSQWFRDYVYIPLGGNRHGEWKTYRNLFLTMLLTGMWHRAAAPQILWGLHFAFFQVLSRALENRLPRFRGIGRIPATFLTFHIVTFGWIFFRAESLEQALGFFASIFVGPWEADPWARFMALQIAFHTLPLVVLNVLEFRTKDSYCVLRLPSWGRASVYLALYLLVVLFGNTGGREFVYFQF